MNSWKDAFSGGLRGEQPTYSAEARSRFHPTRHYGDLDEADGYACITGPCGDTMAFWVQVDDGVVSACTFTTTGCGPSRACGCMAAEMAENQPVEKARRIGQQDILDALGGMPQSHRHCALLAANTLRAAIDAIPDHGADPHAHALRI